MVNWLNILKEHFVKVGIYLVEALCVIILICISQDTDITYDVKIYTYFKEYGEMNRDEFIEYLLDNEIEFKTKNNKIQVGHTKYQIDSGKSNKVTIYNHGFNSNIIDAYRLSKNDKVAEKYDSDEDRIYYKRIYKSSQSYYVDNKIRNCLIITIIIIMIIL